MKLKFKITAGILAIFMGISSFPAASGMSGGVPSQPSRNNYSRLDEARREIAIELGNMPPAQAAAVQNAAQDIVQNGANPENISRFKKCLNGCLSCAWLPYAFAAYFCLCIGGWGAYKLWNADGDWLPILVGIFFEIIAVFVGGVSVAYIRCI